MDYVTLGNPIWSCQFQILGGVRRMAYSAVIYAALLFGATLLWRRLADVTFAAAGAQLLRFLAVAQIGVIVIGGSGAIFRGLMREHTTRMIESLRLSPMRAGAVVAGHLLGDTLQMLVLFLVGGAFGGLLARMNGGGTALAAWVGGNLALLLVGASIWSAVAFFGMGAAKPTNLSAIIAILAATNQLWLSIAPGLGLFVGAFGVIGAWHAMLNSAQLPTGFAVTMAVAVVMGLFWATAAMTRFRRPHGPALSPPTALLLVALACGCGVITAANGRALLPASWDLLAEPSTLVLTAVGAPFLFLHLPTAMAVQNRRRVLLGARRSGRSDGWPLMLWPILSCITAFGSILLIDVLARRVPGIGPVQLEVGATDWAWTAAGYLSAALMAAAMLKLFGLVTGRTGFAALLAIMIWAAPPALSALLAAISSIDAGGPGGAPDWLHACSPVGTVLASWSPRGNRASLPFGLGVQAAITVGLFLLAGRAERLLVKKRKAMIEAEARETIATGG